MKLNKNAIIFVPNGGDANSAFAATTHLAISAHQDDIEFMAYAPIVECFHAKDKNFCGVVTTDGAGSPRSGIYADYTDDDMKKIRIGEQKCAAVVGDYCALAMLGVPSALVKDGADRTVIDDYKAIFKATKPKFVYTHNLADKHETHVATALKVIAALRELDAAELPEKVYGCEVWRNLDWLNDDEKIYLDCSTHPNLSRALSSVFDSQIAGGKRYDLAAEGRRLSNATFSESHACDSYTGLNYAMDLTPLVYDKTLDITTYVTAYIDRFKRSVSEVIKKFEIIK